MERNPDVIASNSSGFNLTALLLCTKILPETKRTSGDETLQTF